MQKKQNKTTQHGTQKGKAGMKKDLSTFILIGILFVAAFFRLFRVSDYMTFLGDEGRDVLVVKGILEGNLTLLGPRASAGDFFTGPIYYYMMTPFLWLWNYDPVGPAIMVGLFGIATVWLVYYVGKKLFDIKTGLIAAALYAVSPLVLTYSRSSWNPNTLPFFALLTMFTLYKAVTESRSWKYFVLTGFLLGICVQLHYISLFLGAVVALSLFLMNWYFNKKIKVFETIKYYVQIFIGFLIGFAPFLAFEVRHGFPNLKTIFGFITKDSAEAGYATYNAFYEPVADVFFRIFGRLVFNFPRATDYERFDMLMLQITGTLIVVSAIAAIIMLVRNKNRYAVILLSVWLVIGVVLFGFYKKPIYDYYLVFIFPLPFLLIGNLFSRITNLKNEKIAYGAIFGVTATIGLFIFNLTNSPFVYEPNKQKEQIKRISDFVASKTDNKPFNFALITPGNSDHGYRYYLEISGHKPVTIENDMVDPERKTVTGQLLVVCEDTSCKPLGHPLYEVAGYGSASISGQWDLQHVKVFRLVPAKAEE